MTRVIAAAASLALIAGAASADTNIGNGELDLSTVEVGSSGTMSVSLGLGETSGHE